MRSGRHALIIRWSLVRIQAGPRFICNNLASLRSLTVETVPDSVPRLLQNRCLCVLFQRADGGLLCLRADVAVVFEHL